jgi:hypothetical protein
MLNSPKVPIMLNLAKVAVIAIQATWGSQSSHGTIGRR